MKTVLTICLLLCAVAPHAATAAGKANPCAGMTFKFYEFVEAQGAFGLATPDRHNVVTQHALNKAANDAWSIERAKGPGRGAEYFQLSSYCEKFRRDYRIHYGHDINELIFACDGDSQSHPGGPASDEPGPAQVMAQCVIVVDRGLPAKPTFEDMQHYSIASGFYNLPIKDSQNRHDLLDSWQFRRDMYSEALRMMINYEVNTSDGPQNPVNTEPEYERYSHPKTDYGGYHSFSSLDPGIGKCKTTGSDPESEEAIATTFGVTREKSSQGEQRLPQREI